MGGTGIVRRWSPKVSGRPHPGALDDLDEVTLLVLDDCEPGDDLGWCRQAPCPVLAVVPAGVTTPAGVDLRLSEGEDDLLLLDAAGDIDDAISVLASRIDAWRGPTRTMMDVLRTSEHLDVARALVVESLAYSMLQSGPAFASWLGSRGAVRVAKAVGAPISVDRVGNELRVRLTRVEVRNAFDASMRDDLVDAFALAAVDASIERVVLMGEGPCFSSGGDLIEFGTSDDVVRAHEIRMLRSVGAAIARVADRTTVHLHGTCVGAGVEMSAFAANVVASPETTFLLPELRMGLIPGAGGTVSIPRRIGRQRTALLALLGTAIDASTARRWQLIDAIESPHRTI